MEIGRRKMHEKAGICIRDVSYGNVYPLQTMHPKKVRMIRRGSSRSPTARVRIPDPGAAPWPERSFRSLMVTPAGEGGRWGRARGWDKRDRGGGCDARRDRQPWPTHGVGKRAASLRRVPQPTLLVPPRFRSGVFGLRGALYQNYIYPRGSCDLKKSWAGGRNTKGKRRNFRGTLKALWGRQLHRVRVR